MSQSEVYDILATFGPLRSAELQKALGLSHAAIHSALSSLQKHGEVAYMAGKGRTGRQGVWWVI